MFEGCGNIACPKEQITLARTSVNLVKAQDESVVLQGDERLIEVFNKAHNNP
jgi:hypothetical protein